MAVPMYLMKPRRDATVESDVELGDQWETGADVTRCLRVKGYCVINGFASADAVKSAANEGDSMQWYRPAALVQEGLLGNEGTSRLARMQVDGANQASLEGIDELVTKLCDAIGPCQDEIGFRCSQRSPAYVCEVGLIDEDDTDLTDAEANAWNTVFACRKIMCMVCLGPDPVVAELKPFDDESNSTELVLRTGSILVTRTDQLSCMCTQKLSTTRLLVSYMLQLDIARMHPDRVEEHLTPAAKELTEYINNRLRDIKEEEPDVVDWNDDDVPRNFVAAANRTYFKRSLTTVGGISIRQPCTWETEIFYLSQAYGMDYAVEVPIIRWNHDEIYDPNPDSWQNEWHLGGPKTSCRHAAFMDGVELFDNKLFGLSLAEVKGMDPSQRLCLEVTYDALHRSGKKKSQLNNSSCGMYVGISISEWNYADRSADVGIFGATGGAPSICAGRLSFCLGCRGASIAVDTEAASGLSCVFWAAESVENKGLGRIQDFACGIGLHLVIAKVWWPAGSASGQLSSEGRCFTFDQAASGHVRQEGIGAAVLRGRKEGENGEDSPDDSLPRAGTLASGASTNSGTTTSMGAPSGPAWQHVIVEACRKAAICPQDIDMVETFGTANCLKDAVEVSSVGECLRGGKNGWDEVLFLGAGKTNGGHAIECSGITGLAKVMHSIQWGIVAPNQHLQQLNSYLDISECPMQINSDCCEFTGRKVFAGVNAFGLGGTNVTVLAFGGVIDEKRPAPVPTPEELRPRLAYWPSGGGDVASGARPRDGYFVVGTFNGWNADEPMKDEGDGVYSYVVALGENKWESFVIQLDGDSDKLLHPGVYKAQKGTELFGPSEAADVGESVWFIDGRTEMVWDAQKSIANQGAASGGDALVPWEGEDSGSLGDRYKITLHVAGKWRAVAWTKLGASTDALAKAPLKGSYSVCGAWNGWDLEEMTESTSTPGVFSVGAKLVFGSNDFYIVRNNDWHQAIFPHSPVQGATSSILGPDDHFSEELMWNISGRPGQSVVIEFQRSVTSAEDKMVISWK